LTSENATGIIFLMKKYQGTDEFFDEKPPPGIIILDRTLGLEYSLCITCRHFNRRSWLEGNKHICATFSDIPLTIWKGETGHANPFPGDKGFRYEKLS